METQKFILEVLAYIAPILFAISSIILAAKGKKQK